MNNYKNAKQKNILTALDAEKQIDEIVYKTEKLLKVKYENRLDDTNIVIRIFGRDSNLKHLQSTDINQYFIDGTYKCIPGNIESIKLLLLIVGYNFKNDSFLMCAMITLSNEKEDTYSKLYKILIEEFSFNPKMITVDFQFQI